MADLPAALRFVRAARGMSLRDVAAEIGVSAATLNRTEQAGADRDLSFSTFVAITGWLCGNEKTDA